ncbi:MAG: branched-chain amino acid ABC transporter permease [Proteobacteria bacterium]|nr:branched-chain amino acid ABC transporter permease [Pseudomonadota bacterium]MDA0971603.1 branched-chain amino acid ABC transporter permease [Pseudomonadota bacterium]MDA0995865.1 branched-chain amino acid ABC transporter permease [Pseudomonadota bacterium]
MSGLNLAKQEPVFNTNKSMVYVLFGFLGFLILFPVLSPSQFLLHLMIMIFMNAVISQSWNIIGGFSGQISLGHGAFFGIGAYASSFFYVEFGLTPWIGIIIGILICAVIAILVGIPMLRLSGHYFAIATLLVGISFQVVFQRWDLVGAASGLWIPLTSEDSYYAMQFHSSKAPYYYLFLIFFVIIFFITWLISRSKLGYRLRAVRDDAQAAQSLGIDVAKHKIIAFAISAMMMAPMGSLFAQYILIVDPDRMFNFEISIIALLISVLGGVGYVWGPLVGTIIIIPLAEYARIFFGGTGGALDLMVYGIVLMIICVFKPSGIISLLPNHILHRKKKR